MQETLTEINASNPIYGFFLEEDSINESSVKKWTKSEYYRLADLRFFDEKKVELIEGDIIEMAAMNSPHISCVLIVDEVLRGIIDKNFHIRTQGTLDLGTMSQPEPDVAIVKGKIRDYVDAHPKTAELIVEVSDSTLSSDRNSKARLYAKNKIKDYWIINLNSRSLEVYRRPIKDKKLGFIYSEIQIFTESDEVSPLAVPKAKIKVADLLP